MKGAPTLYDLVPQLLSSIQGRSVICYNDEFDMRLIEQTAKKYDLPGRGRNLTMLSRCAMAAYSQFIGQQSKFSHEHEYVRQKLPRCNEQHHQSIDDCLLTLDLLRQLADTRKRGEPAGYDWR